MTNNQGFTPDRGAFKPVLNAIASRDPERIEKAEDDALVALSSVGTLLNVVADYIHIRANHPHDALYATDEHLAEAVYTLSDLSACIHSTLIEASNARFHQSKKKSKEG